MNRYKAWCRKDKILSKSYTFKAKSLRAAKQKATSFFAIQYGRWYEGTVFLKDGTPVCGHTKQEMGRAGAFSTSPKLYLIELPTHKIKDHM